MESKELEQLRKENEFIKSKLVEDQKIKELYELYKEILNSILSKGGSYNDKALTENHAISLQ